MVKCKYKVGYVLHLLLSPESKTLSSVVGTIIEKGPYHTWYIKWSDWPTTGPEIYTDEWIDEWCAPSTELGLVLYG